jgi:hypothetical protein
MTWAIATATRWQATKKVMARVARAMLTTTMVAGKQQQQHRQWQRHQGWQATKRVMARAARGVVMTTKRAMATATTWVMVMATRVEGNKEGDGGEKGEGTKGNGDNKGGRQAT